MEGKENILDPIGLIVVGALVVIRVGWRLLRGSDV
jgi:hypothetical protein